MPRRTRALPPWTIWALLCGLLLLAGGLGRQLWKRSRRAELVGQQHDVLLVLLNGLREQEELHEALWQGLGKPPERRYTRAWAQSVHPWTSMGALLTGRYPSSLPLCTWPQSMAEPPWCARLPQGVTKLPDLLALHGYATALVWGQLRMQERGLLEEHFDEVRAGELEGSLPLAQAWWRAKEAQPRLLVVVDDLGMALEAEARVRRLSPEEKLGLQRRWRELAEERGTLLRPLVEEVLRQEQRPALVVLTAAHGLSLGEDGGIDRPEMTAVHHEVLLDRSLHVPLSLTGARIPRGEVSDLVEHIDLMPTLARLAQVEVLPAGLQGQDLLSPATPRSHAYAEFGDMLALRSPRHLLTVRFWIHNGGNLDPELDRRLQAGPSEARASWHLHDLERDPLQEQDLAQSEPELLEELATELQRRRAASIGAGGLSEAQQEALQAVQSEGYW